MTLCGNYALVSEQELDAWKTGLNLQYPYLLTLRYWRGHYYCMTPERVWRIIHPSTADHGVPGN